MNKAVVLASMAAAASLCARGALATSLSLNPSKDNTLYEDPNGMLSNGVGASLFIGETNNFGARRALMEFDLSTVPAGATITSATIKLTVSKTNTGSTPIEFHHVLKEWGEGTSNASA